jgi:hypothetical protein
MPVPENMTPLSPEQRRLAAAHVALADAAAARWARRYPRHRDELASQAAWGLVKAAQGWRPGPLPFYFLARESIERSIINMFRYYRQMRRDWRRTVPIRRDELVRQDAGLAAAEARADAIAIMARAALPPTLATAAVEMLTHARPVAEIAADNHVSRRMMFKRRTRALERLQCAAGLEAW